MPNIKKFLNNSGPAWIQAAVTLGGGTLVSSLYIGVIGGYQFLWVPMLSMLSGIMMLWALSFVSLSPSIRGKRPFEVMKSKISPTLAWAWLLSTVFANVTFCAAQFALATDAIQKNLSIEDVPIYLITLLIALFSFLMIYGFSQDGKITTYIQHFIKALVALIVLSFMGVAIVLFNTDQLPIHDILH